MELCGHGLRMGVVEIRQRVPIREDHDQHEAITEDVVDPCEAGVRNIRSRLIYAVLESGRNIDVDCAARDGLVTGWSRDGVPAYAQKPTSTAGIVPLYTADETSCVR